ncbi:hypothetical protein [Kineococcus sp. NPDC059986]|uniref:hypothetical protein n=1 Tax=Kineococcus sp. NPDC059986 TaxID=3155538 RepID=UPI00344B92D6
MSRTLSVIRFLFTLATVALVLGGIVLVAAQALALVLGRGAWLEAVPEVVGPPTLVSASVAGLLAFVLSYRREDGAAADGDEDAHHTADGTARAA